MDAPEHATASSDYSQSAAGKDGSDGVVRLVLQTSPFWQTWKGSKTYRFTVIVQEGVIASDQKMLSVPGHDVYCVAYLTRNRNGTKQKTRLLRRTYKPAWHQALSWSGVDYLEHFTVELKTPNLLMSENPCLGWVHFTVAEVAAMSDEEMRMKEFHVLTEKPDFRAKIKLGFAFDPRIPGDVLRPTPFYEGADIFEHVPLYYTIGKGCMCVSLYADTQQYLDQLDYRALCELDLIPEDDGDDGDDDDVDEDEVEGS